MTISYKVKITKYILGSLLPKNRSFELQVKQPKILGHLYPFEFTVFFFVFSHTCKNCYKTQTRTPIALKFGTQKGSTKANPSIKFGANPVNDSRVMTDYSRKTRSICCHAYRVNRFME